MINFFREPWGHWKLLTVPRYEFHSKSIFIILSRTHCHFYLTIGSNHWLKLFLHHKFIHLQVTPSWKVSWTPMMTGTWTTLTMRRTEASTPRLMSPGRGHQRLTQARAAPSSSRWSLTSEHWSLDWCVWMSWNFKMQIAFLRKTDKLIWPTFINVIN